MNLYAVHQITKCHSAPQSQTNENVFCSCVTCPKSMSSCHRVLDCWVDCSRLVVQRQKNFCHPNWVMILGSWDDAGDGAVRTKTTVPRVVSDELAFFRLTATW